MDACIENLSYFCFRKIRWDLSNDHGYEKVIVFTSKFGR